MLRKVNVRMFFCADMAGNVWFGQSNTCTSPITVIQKGLVFTVGLFTTHRARLKPVLGVDNMLLDRHPWQVSHTLLPNPLLNEQLATIGYCICRY